MITKKQFINNVIDNGLLRDKKQIRVIKKLNSELRALHTFTLDRVLSIEEMKEFIRKYFKIDSLIIYKKGFYFIY